MILATEKSLRRPDFVEITAGAIDDAELERIRIALSDLQHVMDSGQRDLIQERTKTLNRTTQRLAEIMMNRSVRAALAGKNVKDVQ